jgi:hypothetical protein
LVHELKRHSDRGSMNGIQPLVQDCTILVALHAINPLSMRLLCMLLVRVLPFRIPVDLVLSASLQRRRHEGYRKNDGRDGISQTRPIRIRLCRRSTRFTPVCLAPSRCSLHFLSYILFSNTRANTLHLLCLCLIKWLPHWQCARTVLPSANLWQDGC